MHERPSHEVLIEGIDLEAKVKRAFKLGFKYLIKYTFNDKDSRYFVRSHKGALDCKVQLENLGVIGNIVDLRTLV